MQASPPDTTEICGVVTDATAPASKSPTLGPPLTTAMWIDDNLPRILENIAEAGDLKAHFVLFPEMALTGYHARFKQPQAAAALDDMLGDLFIPGRKIAVLGMLADKDAAAVAAALARRFDSWYLIDLSGHRRGRTADQLAQAVRPALDRVPVITGGRIDETLGQISADSSPDDLVVVFGSFLTVAGAMTWLEQGPGKAVKR